VSIYYAALFPERVKKLVAIEGLGPAPQLAKELESADVCERSIEWIDQVREFSGRQPRRYPSIEAAAQRMLEENSFLSREQANHLTIHGVSRNEDGTFSWKFDNYVRIFYPQRWDSEQMRQLWGRISCPTLLMRGSESWASDPAIDGRMDAFPDARLVNVSDAGHWVHHDRLDVFLREIRAFLDE
jgi:pimeloyl-ACP methyl ester carboxylesterase